MWHKLSGYPDNVTDEGVVVDADEGRRLQSEKRLLHAEIAGAERVVSTERGPSHCPPRSKLPGCR